MMNHFCDVEDARSLVVPESMKLDKTIPSKMSKGKVLLFIKLRSCVLTMENIQSDVCYAPLLFCNVMVLRLLLQKWVARLHSSIWSCSPTKYFYQCYPIPKIKPNGAKFLHERLWTVSIISSLPQPLYVDKSKGKHACQCPQSI